MSAMEIRLEIIVGGDTGRDLVLLDLDSDVVGSRDLVETVRDFVRNEREHIDGRELDHYRARAGGLSSALLEAAEIAAAWVALIELGPPEVN